MSKCFISHATPDRKFVENELMGLLDALNIVPWYSKEDIETSQQWELAIKDALGTSDWFLLVISSQSASSEWVKHELHWWLENGPKDRLIPVVLEKCDLVSLHIGLPRIQSLDFSKDATNARNRLIKVFRAPQILRENGIIGQWSGRVEQFEGREGQPLESGVRVNLVIDKGTISGDFILDNPDMAPTKPGDFVVTGGLHHDRFLQLNYRVQDRAIVQFGSILVELDDNADVMVGKFVGYGARSRKIVWGDVRVNRTAGKTAGSAGGQGSRNRG